MRVVALRKFFYASREYTAGEEFDYAEGADLTAAIAVGQVKPADSKPAAPMTTGNTAALMLGVLTALLVSTAAEAAKRPLVVIPPAPVQPIVSTPPLIIVPPLAVGYDLAIRTSCDPRVIAIGSGPGFDPKQPIVGNFLLPAIYTRCGYPTPKWLQPALPPKRS